MENRKKAGDAMIMVICFLALIVALSSALLTATSVVKNSAQLKLNETKCRIMAESLNTEIREAMLDETLNKITCESTGDVYTIENSNNKPSQILCEDTLRNDSKYINGIWFFLKDKLKPDNDKWKYYDENESGHELDAATKEFTIDNDSRSGIASSIRLYWTHSTTNKSELNGIRLTVQAICEKEKAKCVVTSVYSLATRTDTYAGELMEDPEAVTPVTYTRWTWSLVNAKN